MQSDDLTKKLAFDDSPNFLRAGRKAFERAPAFGHIFRRATERRRGDEPGPGLIGVYTLRSPKATANTPSVPAVYVCRADSAATADHAHKLVWNQDVVPFVLVESPDGYRLYSGFEYERRPKHQAKNLLQTFGSVADLADAGFHADAIDDGELWRKWGHVLRPEARVDWTLLENLQKLGAGLRERGLDAQVSHSLIGKYVYLHYLRDRDILSDRKLAAWDIPKEAVFGRAATLDGLRRIVRHLDAWLNGAVFPLPLSGKDAPDDLHVQWVAATFAGDEAPGRGHRQLHLDFRAYDFSYIPIETLSVVYEQFLHAPTGDRRSRGKEAGAYYTPIPVVNFAEMEDRKTLQQGTRVLDPSCGSGAFLVQCYRRLIEKEYPARGPRPRPAQLRDLLQRCIFGIDRDGDACGVAELSLILTLLDYCDPPDLWDGPQFKLPSLRNENVFAENFFRRSPDCRSLLGRRKFDWIVGNPPWKGLNPKKLAPDDAPVWEWMEGQAERETPVGDNEVAQAFAWNVAPYMAADGVAGLLMPAMALFEEPSQPFREKFFKRFRVHSIANFSNLTESLFAGRSRDPAAAFFYSLRPGRIVGGESFACEAVTVYSPFVANQEVTRPVVAKKRNETWSLVLNASEVRAVRLADALKGSALPWKLASWGSHLDLRLLEKLAARFDSIGALEEAGALVLSRGPELFASGGDDESSYDKVQCAEVVNKKILDVHPLKKLRHIFAFPPKAICDNDKVYLRSRGGDRGLLVCRPPHVIVSEARNFAVFTDEYLVVPSGQIGIASAEGDARLLKALALLLNSDFAFYHQFLVSSRLGIKRPVATLSALRDLPAPLLRLPADQLAQWAALHDQLVAISQKRFARKPADNTLFDDNAEDHDDEPPVPDAAAPLLKELNIAVYAALGLEIRDQALVEDLVRVRLQLDDGRLGLAAVGPPKEAHLRRYAMRLKAELDQFVGDELSKRHDVEVIHDDYTGMVQVTLVRGSETAGIGVHQADEGTAAALSETRRRLRRQHAQWVYFDRNLQIFEGRRTFVLKPMQRFHWTESQAMSDAAEIISQTLDAEAAR